MRTAATVILSLLATTHIYAGSTGFNSLDDDIYLSNGSTYAMGGVVLLVTFSTPPTTNTTYANAAGTFTELARAPITSSGGFPIYSGSYTTKAADAGKQVYQWLFNSNPSTTTPTQQALFTSPTWTLTGGAGADVKQISLRTGTAVIGTKTVVANIPTITFANVPVTGINPWRSGQFSLAELNNSALENTLWGDNADPDGDGLKNSLEFVLGTQPRSSDGSSRTPRSSVTGGSLVMSYKRPLNGVSGVTYGVEIKNNSDLQANDAGWSPATLNTHYSQTATPNGDGTETVKITFLTPVSGKTFGRVSFTY